MKYLLIILFLPSQTIAVNCEKNPIFCHITRVKPNINKTFAMKLSDLIYKYSKKYNTDPHISVAIGRQETGLREISRKETVIQFNPEPVYITGYTDICMFQFHSRTIKNYKLDAYKLYTDLDYCVEQHIRLLRKKIRTCEKRLANVAWRCYHSFNDDTGKYYQKLVERYL